MDSAKPAMMASYRWNALQERGRECSECGASRSLVVHHLDGDRGNNSLSNLIVLCRSCHGKVHGGADGFEHLTEQLPESALTTDGNALKDELVGTYMYLPEGLKEDVDRYYKKLSGDYEFEFGDELEKNRHYYQLVVRHGFETVREAEIEEVREMVESL